MADAKMINYGQPIGAGSTVVPDNTSEALDIESTDAKDYIVVDTTDGNEVLNLSAGGAAGQRFQVRPTYVTYAASDSVGLLSTGATSTTPNVLPNVSDSDTGIGRADADRLSLIAGGTEALRLGGGGVIGKLETSLTDNGGTASVSTSGSSTALVGVNTAFTTDFHVGAAIKVGSVITTVTAITDDNNLTLQDAIDTGSTGTTCTRDSGELFAVKTGDSKTLFSVQPTGAIGAGANANSNVGVYNNLGIGDPTMFDKLTTGNALLVVGNQAGDYDFTTANSLIGIGYGAVANSTTSQNLVAIGAYSADTSTNIRESVIIGGGAGRSSGNDSVHIGHGAGKYCTGTKNVSIGREALQTEGAAAESVAVGYHALEEATGSWNVGVGYTAGDSIVGGQGNVMLGHGTDNGAGSNYGVAIGISSVCNGHRENLIGASISSYGANTTTIGNDEQNFIVNEGVGTCSIGALDRPFGGLMTMARKILSIERSLGQVNTTDTGKIDQLTAFGGVSAVKIPAYSIITFCSLTMTDASGASTHNAMVATSTTSGTSDGTALAGTVVEIIGAGAAGTRSTDTTGSATDIDLKAAPGKTWYNDSKFHVGSSDVYLYVATAGTSNSGSAGTCKAILTVEYIGVD